MDSHKIPSNPNPREKANIMSILFWWWAIDLFKTGYKKVLEPGDLFDPLKTDRSTLLGDRLETHWNKELKTCKKRQKEASLLKTIFRTFWWEYFLLGIIQIINEFVIRLGMPKLLGGLLSYFKKGSVVTYETALFYAIGMSMATAVNAIMINQAVFGAFHIGAKIRVAVCSVVYRKALRLSASALGETAPGKIVNLVANDVNRFDLVSIFIHYMWSAPLSAIVISYFLYVEIGYPGLLGIGIVFIVVPIQAYTGKLSSKFRLQTAIRTDERVRLMDEIISGVQVIKMYAWEKPFCALIEMARKSELRIVIKSSYIRGIYMTFNLFTTRMALYCTLVAMLMAGRPVSADKIFVVSSYYHILAQTMSGMFVRGFAEIAECMVSVRRLQCFLMYDEFEGNNATRPNKTNQTDSLKRDSEEDSIETLRNLPYIDDDDDNNKTNGSIVEIPDLLKKKPDVAIEINNFTAKWESEQSENTLEGIDLQIEKGKLYAVIGMVGAGKSSFLSAILGEIKSDEGRVEVFGDLSYSSQEAWVFGSTIRQNIIFGQIYERQRYQRVVKACTLLRDFKQFPQGDQTVVGERGSSLSGGQKARINLARSLYRQADVYLMDDPLSAVDAHVSKHLFKECIQQFLNGKTRILATHQLQYIKGVDAIILLEQGKMKLFSHYQDLLDYRPNYGELLVPESETGEGSSLEKQSLKRHFSSSSNKSRTPEASGCGTDDEDDNENLEKLNDGLESTSRGVIKGSLFLKYFQSGVNLFVLGIILLLFVLTQLTVSSVDYFTPILVTEQEAKQQEFKKITNLDESNANYTSVLKNGEFSPWDTTLYIYTGLVIGIFVIAVIRSFVFYKSAVTCSQGLHNQSFHALIRTGMRFYDTNPSGRILNRFSKDLGVIDEWLPKTMLDSGQIILMMTGSLIVASIVNPFFLLPIAFSATVFYWIRKVYLKTSKNIKRLEGITRSPVFTHLNATLNGLSTIRAYEAQNILKKEFDQLQDSHTSTVYMFISTSTAFGFSLDIFCFLFLSIVVFSFIIVNQSFSGGDVGLAITQVMALIGMIQWGMRQSAEVANLLMAVERVLEYSQLPPEPNLREHKTLSKKKTVEKLPATVPTVPPDNWPNKGLIQFIDLHLRYVDDEPPVLKGLNLTMLSSEKVGIVGRTGAGKSSLISALFRLAAKIDGVIEIDGIDTGSIFIEDLRRRISIIPQDPVLFSGTLRRNLDPFDEFEDRDLWAALEEVELKDAVVISGNGLDSRVFDRGSNYSVGQRQLVCLARAILRNNKVLMLDEATANVDPETDSLIQRTIRKKFANCTVLTVAHRLNTIIDSDKVLVMDKGRMVEYDHPYILLQNVHGQFTSLVKETGRAMYDQLVKLAKQSYESKCVHR